MAITPEVAIAEILPGFMGALSSWPTVVVTYPDKSLFRRQSLWPFSMCQNLSPHSEGLVTFLVYPPDELVLAARIQWLR
jgi:hypothetical protein